LTVSRWNIIHNSRLSTLALPSSDRQSDIW
jgi:hypothetical protein